MQSVSPNCTGQVGVGSYRIETHPDNSVNDCQTGSSYNQIIFVEAVTKPQGYIHLYLTNVNNAGLRSCKKRNIKLSKGGTDRNSVGVTPQASGVTGKFDIEIYHSTTPKYPSDNYFSNHSRSDRIPIEIDIV